MSHSSMSMTSLTKVNLALLSKLNPTTPNNISIPYSLATRGQRICIHPDLQPHQSLRLLWVFSLPDPKTATPSTPSPKPHPLPLLGHPSFSLTSTYYPGLHLSNRSLGKVSTSSPWIHQPRSSSPNLPLSLFANPQAPPSHCGY